MVGAAVGAPVTGVAGADAGAPDGAAAGAAPVLPWKYTTGSDLISFVPSLMSSDFDVNV